MSKRLQIFISSTSSDLQEHRQAVFDAILQAGGFGIDMKHFGSRPHDPQTVCRSEIEGADVVVGVYAWRYGWVPERESRSITEIEFDYAQSLGKPCLCYVVDESFCWPPKFIQFDALEPLSNLKKKVSRLVRSKFTTPDNLAKLVMADLARMNAKVESGKGEEQDIQDDGIRILIARGELFEAIKFLLRKYESGSKDQDKLIVLSHQLQTAIDGFGLGLVTFHEKVQMEKKVVSLLLRMLNTRKIIEKGYDVNPFMVDKNFGVMDNSFLFQLNRDFFAVYHMQIIAVLSMVTVVLSVLLYQ